MTRPFPLIPPGGTIGVFAPSSYRERMHLEAGAERIKALGFHVKFHPQAFGRLAETQSAGTHAEKIAALHDLLHDPSVDAIMAAGGGNRALHLLDQIDYSLLAKRNIPIIGFSDITALQNAAYAHAGLIGFHGPMADGGFGRWYKEDEAQQFKALVTGATRTIPLPGADVLSRGMATGVLLGGNLPVFQAMLDTPHAPDLSDAILFLEDGGDQLSRYDRMFWSLRATGILERIAGLILGDFSDLQDTGRPFGFTMDEIIAEHTAGLDIPIVTHAPFGHGGRITTLPVGAQVVLVAEPGGVRVEILDMDA